jgi:hypothetical protein
VPLFILLQRVADGQWVPGLVKYKAHMRLQKRMQQSHSTILDNQQSPVLPLAREEQFSMLKMICIMQRTSSASRCNAIKSCYQAFERSEYGRCIFLPTLLSE